MINNAAAVLLNFVGTGNAKSQNLDIGVTWLFFTCVSGSLQQGQAAVQVLPPAAAPQGPATHQRQEPPRPQERRPPTGQCDREIMFKS